MGAKKRSSLIWRPRGGVEAVPRTATTAAVQCSLSALLPGRLARARNPFFMLSPVCLVKKRRGAPSFFPKPNCTRQYHCSSLQLLLPWATSREMTHACSSPCLAAPRRASPRPTKRAMPALPSKSAALSWRSLACSAWGRADEDGGRLERGRGRGAGGKAHTMHMQPRCTHLRKSSMQCSGSL